MAKKVLEKPRVLVVDDGTTYTVLYADAPEGGAPLTMLGFRRGLFRRLKDRLSKTKSGIISQIKKAISLRGRLDEELLEQIEDDLALAKGVEERRHGTDVDRVSGQPDQMAGNALQLREDGSNVAGPRR